jgi:hypothetical protein
MSSLAEISARRWWQESPVTKESTKETVKTIVQGMPVESVLPVVTTLVCFSFSHARPRVRRAPGIPCALCLLEDETMHHSGAIASRECADVRLKCLWLFEKFESGLKRQYQASCASLIHA